MLALGLMLVMMAGLLGGCGKSGRAGEPGIQGTPQGEAGASNTDNTAEKDGNGQTSEEETEKTAMGRYVETAVDISEISGKTYGVTVLSDGRLLIPDETAGQLISADGGVSWEAVPIPGIDSMADFTKERYIFSMTAAPDGSVAVLFVENGDYDKTGTFHPLLHAAMADGTVLTMDTLSVQEDDTYVSDIYYSQEGELFATVVGSGAVYLVDVENGTLTKEVSLEWSPDLVKFQGDYMFFLTSRDGVTIWDRKEQKLVEDDVLSDFMEENYQNDYYADDSFTVYMTPGEEGVLYIAGNGGMYRHVIGGSAMEQIVDGALSSFSNPSLSLRSVAAYGENEFVAVFRDRIVLYKYDPNVPTVPENMVSVYSLEEQNAVRQAIAQFQAENPNMFVRYEVGRSGMDAASSEDAIKKLNTELMAGEGPDVIILDGLPVMSYEEKGILKDLKPHIDSLTGDAVLLPNMVEAFTRDGGVYMMPVSFSIPMLAGRQEDLEKISNYEDLAAATEKIRVEHPEAEIGRFFSEEAMMRWFLPVTASAFVEEEGGIDEEALSEFLTLTNRIYTAAIEGLSDTARESYGYQKDFYKTEQYAYQNFNNIAQQADDFQLENMELAAGMLKNVYGYQEVLSLKYCDGLSDVDVKYFGGMSEGVFEPSVLVGVNAASRHQEDAQRFFDIIMGTQVQGLLYDGFMVNQAALESQLSPKWKVFQNGGMNVDYGEVSSSLGGSTGDGREFHLDIYMPTKEEFQKLYDLCCSLKTAYIADSVVENAVIENGAQYLQGYLSQEEVVHKIMTKVEIYMAE